MWLGWHKKRINIALFPLWSLWNKMKVLNLKREKTVVLKTCEYNTSYIPVHIIIPWIKWGDNGGNLPTVYIDILIIDILSWAERGRERIAELKKLPKITRVLVTRFDNFHHLCNFYIFGFCLLSNNLASSILKCEGSLTLLIKFSLKRRMCRNNYKK